MTEKTAIFAGGCFWCMQPPFDNQEGVISTAVGYAGGEGNTANYDKVSMGTSGHREVFQVKYDSQKVKYEQLLEIFWQNIDPFQGDGQLHDRGHQYTTAIYYNDETEKAAAEKSKAEYENKFGKKIATAIEPSKEFYAAEDYHQDYYKKNPLRYGMYSTGSDRKEHLKKIWSDTK